MLNLFKNKTTSFLGIDIGTNSIKLVELESVAGRPRLVTYGMVEIESSIAGNSDSSDVAADNQKIAGTLAALLKKTGARSRTAVAALPNFSVFSSVISLPKLGDKQLAEAVSWEAKKFVPMPIENVVLDWKILNEETQEAGVAEAGDAEKGAQQEVPKQLAAQADQNSNLAKCKTIAKILLTAAPRHLVERYVAVFKLAGVSLLSLETESFALARCLVGNEAGTILIADVGALTTDVTVVKKGVPVFSRSINVGGGTVTRAIADSMGVATERAEQFKRDTGMARSSGGAAGAASGVAKVIQQSFSPVISEMKYTLERESAAGTPIEKILLTGGSAFLSSLDSHISESLGVKVFIANPWARVSYPKDLGGVLDQIAPRMGVAVGLAMREIE
ncbi:MAG: pilus assembly protein PilM [Parcubacteria group bacterium]|nr:pilus assembly protein PilM [Parcubacteria group bacterium]